MRKSDLTSKGKNWHKEYYKKRRKENKERYKKYRRERCKKWEDFKRKWIKEQEKRIKLKESIKKELKQPK